MWNLWGVREPVQTGFNLLEPTGKLWGHCWILSHHFLIGNLHIVWEKEEFSTAYDSASPDILGNLSLSQSSYH